MVSSVLQWLLECHTSKPAGKSTRGRHLVVFQALMSWGGNNEPDRVHASKAIISCMLSRPVTATLTPCSASIHKFASTLIPRGTFFSFIISATLCRDLSSICLQSQEASSWQLWLLYNWQVLFWARWSSPIRVLKIHRVYKELQDCYAALPL